MENNSHPVFRKNGPDSRCPNPCKNRGATLHRLFNSTLVYSTFLFLRNLKKELVESYDVMLSGKDVRTRASLDMP